MAKKLTLNALARTARVSPATVSRVVAGNPTVDPAIRAHVRKVAEKMGLDLEQRRKGRSRIIAFLLANRDVLHNFHARVLLGAEAYCAEHDWELLFMSFRYAPDAPPEALHLPQLLSRETNARAVILGGSNSPNLFQALHTRGIPFAVLGNNVTGEWSPQHCDVAYSDDITGAYDVTMHLIAKGHRRIGFIGNRQLPWFRRCETGYLRAMAEAGLEPASFDFRPDGAQLGYLATKSLFLRKQSLTALVAGSDQVAAGVYSALREMNLSVPEDMSVVGINDTQGQYLSPELTSVREFPEELGRHLAEFVLNRVRNPLLPRQEVTIPTQLVQRASVAPPSKGARRPAALPTAGAAAT